MTNHQLFPVSSKPWTPHAYQKKAVKFLLEHAASALFLDPGLGKTSITLAAIKLLKQRKLIDKVLLVAPLRVCHAVWPKELQKWTDFNGLRAVVLHGPNKDELLKQDADIYIVNPEGLEWLTQAQVVRTPSGKVSVSVDLKRWKKLGFDTLVIDELTKFKNTNSVRFKMAKLVLGTFGRRWGLTGSPASNGLMDLFGQCYMLDQGRSLGPFITHYRNTYFNPGYDGFSWVLKEGAEQLIYERLAPLALRMAAEDYIDMPQLVNNIVRVDLPQKAREVYDALEDHLIAQIEERKVRASNAGVASMKCRQVANGGVYLDPEVEALVKLPKGKREWVDLHDVKAEAVADLVEELQGSPVLIAYDFGHDLNRLLDKLGKDTPYIGGGVNTARSNELEAAWNRGELPVLLGHPQSIGHGLNLQESGYHVIWYSLTWDYELYDQFIRRVWRQGNNSRRVFVHHIVAANTIDEVIYQVLQHKGRGQQALFEGLKKLRQR